MKDYLLSCYFDKMSVKEAVDFVQRGMGVKVSKKVLDQVKKTIKECTGKDWE